MSKVHSIFFSVLFAVGLSCALSCGASTPTGDGDADGDGDIDADGDTDIDGDADGDGDSEWVYLTGGAFYPGRASSTEVTISSFEMMRSEVTVAMYRTCVDEGSCTEPDTGDRCNWLENAREDHPINCLNWQQLRDYCEWAAARLPTDMEWEYAARSGGLAEAHPWGDDEPDCNKAVYDSCNCDGHSCAVCTHPDGNTEQGLCNMAANVYEWVEDCWHYELDGVPVDGSAWVTDCLGDDRVIRPGSFDNADTILSNSLRFSYEPEGQAFDLGGRCARNAGP